MTANLRSETTDEITRITKEPPMVNINGDEWTTHEETVVRLSRNGQMIVDEHGQPATFTSHDDALHVAANWETHRAPTLDELRSMSEEELRSRAAGRGRGRTTNESFIPVDAWDRATIVDAPSRVTGEVTLDAAHPLAVDVAALEARTAGCDIDDLVAPNVGRLTDPG